MGKEIPDGFRNKYVLLGKSRDNYRFISANEVLINRDANLPKFVLSFLLSEGIAIMVANIISGEVVSLLLRSLNSKKFIDVGGTKALMYGIGDFDNFVYGTPIVLVEGVADRDVVREMYPYVLSVKSSSVSTIQREILTRLTYKFVLAFDNDSAGQYGNNRAKKLLEKNGCKCVIHKVYGMKDAGEIYDTLLSDPERSDRLRKDYEDGLKCAITCLR